LVYQRGLNSFRSTIYKKEAHKANEILAIVHKQTLFIKIVTVTPLKKMAWVEAHCYSASDAGSISFDESDKQCHIARQWCMHMLGI